jgi:hypothetical protein
MFSFYHLGCTYSILISHSGVDMKTLLLLLRTGGQLISLSLQLGHTTSCSSDRCIPPCQAYGDVYCIWPRTTRGIRMRTVEPWKPIRHELAGASSNRGRSLTSCVNHRLPFCQNHSCCDHGTPTWHDWQIRMSPYATVLRRSLHGDTAHWL